MFTQDAVKKKKKLLKVRSIMMQAYLRKQEKSQISNLNLALKIIQEREQAIGKVRRSKEII